MLGFASEWRHIPSSAGHHRPKQKRPSAVLRPRFFALYRPLRKRASDGAAQHEKSAQLALSAFALVVIRLGFEPKTHSLEGCCSIQLSYRTDPYVFPVRWNALQWKVGAKVVKIFGIARVEINTLLFICGEPVKCDGVEIRGGAGGYVLAIWCGAPSQIEGVSLAGGVDEGDCLPVGLQRESMEDRGEMVAFVGAEVDERASGILEANALAA